MTALSVKFPSDGLFRVGQLMLLQTEDEGFALQNVHAVTQEGLSLSDFDPLHTGDPKEPSLFPYSSIFFPQARPKPQPMEDLYALFDLAATDPASLAPDWTTVYYKARMGKTKKTVAKGYRTVQYIAADGAVTSADLPMEAWLPGESAPFPTCMVPQPINAMQILLSVAAAGGETAPAPTPTAAAAAAASASPAAAAAAVTPTAGSAAIASPRIPSPAVHGGTASTSAPAGPLKVKAEPTAAAAAAPSTRVPSPAIHRVGSPAVHGAPIATGAPAGSLSIDVHKRKRTDSMSDVVGGGNVSPASAASGSAPASPNASAAAKRARKAAKKEKKVGGGDAEKEKAGSWHIDLPADPRHHALLDRWNVESLQLVVPALKPLSLEGANTGAEASAEPSVKREQPDATDSTADSSAAPPATASADHPLIKSLQHEFAQWNKLHGSAEQSAAAGSSSTSPSSATAAASSSSAASGPALCPFVSFKSALGCTQHFDQLQFLPEKQLAVAPFVLDYLHGEDE